MALSRRQFNPGFTIHNCSRASAALQCFHDSMNQSPESCATPANILSRQSLAPVVAYSCEKSQLRCRAAPWGGQAGASPGPTSLS